MIDIANTLVRGRYHYNWAPQLMRSLDILTQNGYVSALQIAESGGQLLEIGSFEGLGANILYEYLIKGTANRITCVDPFPFVRPFPSRRKIREAVVIDTFGNFVFNTAHFSDQIRIYREFSNNVALERRYYSFIYVDGDHAMDSVYKDAIIAMKSATVGGIILFDDYRIPGQDTKIGIDKFIDENKASLDVIYCEYQLAVRIKDATV